MKPALDDLGTDLLTTRRWQRRLALARPLLGVAAYVLAAALGLWWLTPLIMFGIFVAVVTVTHDVVHRSIGLGPRATEWALFLCGLVLLESGHAYRATHLQHHRAFPSAPSDDPEGYPAHLGPLAPCATARCFSCGCGGGRTAAPLLNAAGCLPRPPCRCSSSPPGPSSLPCCGTPRWPWWAAGSIRC